MPPLDDIPEAARDTPLGNQLQAKPQGRWRLPKVLKWLIIFSLAALAALAAGVFAAWYQTEGIPRVDIAQTFQAMITRPSAAEATGAAPEEAPTSLDRALQLAPTSRSLLGHLAYDEAPEAELVPLAANASIRLRAAAAAQFEAMSQAAASAGITLVPLSGFRTYAEQEQIFFSLKAERGQSAETRAEVSAPPGYSEHHTGYAIDLGDATQPGNHLNEGFASTRAYQWLTENAVRFGFELSFPPENLQGVAFEPWHWRFVGDVQSLETFYRE
ncbi:MAG: D-alanyl-D-alanine carboxypeptidase family protein [Nodosilinea sp.]